MKRKKVLLMFLICVLIISTSALPSFANSQIYNATKLVNHQITDIQQAIILIEQRFLGVNEDGTSYIKADAAKYIDSKVLDDITKGMNDINKEILSGVLVRDKSTNVITSTDYTAQSTVEGYFVWKWYGYDYVIDAYNAGLAAIEFRMKRDILIAGGAIAAFFGYGTWVLATGIDVIIYNSWIAACEEGQYTGRGACLCCLGKPDGVSALMNVYAM
ncbi:MAG: hypothetical protein A4E53_02342 [Pelotomaculum sp. PtaB.Bin104]|nr:MAG: hypothetical protein A4E53_02342 [Pelotomaculum sp. PtaB.Bin104]